MIDSSFISNLRPGKNIFFVIYRSVVISSVFLIFIFRISELFDIIIEYPDSLPAIYDLKVSIKRHAQVFSILYSSCFSSCCLFWFFSLAPGVLRGHWPKERAYSGSKNSVCLLFHVVMHSSSVASLGQLQGHTWHDHICGMLLTFGVVDIYIFSPL